MGAYINPKLVSKEMWLEDNKETSQPFPPKWENATAQDCLPVCLVDNGFFTAAGICFSKEELHCFSDKDDIRPKTWYIVKIDKLHEVSPELKNYII